ncbi:MAG: hypothetical protein U9P61_00925 [Patescibacteria group bacterium]|nr:hypothetical protein [Patescibacteria group bacterium]
MKKIITFLLIIGILAFSPILVLADDPIISDSDDVITMIGGFASFLWTIFLAVTVIFFIISGITFFTAAGDPEKFKKAKRMFLYGVVGTAVGILAGGMAELIQSLLEESTI